MTEGGRPGGSPRRSPRPRAVPEDYLVIARVLGPHGVRGEIKCRIVTEFPERFQKGTRVFLGEPPAPRTIRGATVEGDYVRLLLSGTASREAAETLRGENVLVHTDDAVELPAGRFYWHQVIGLRVDDQTGRSLGVVRDIIETGANDVYVVHGDWGEVLVPVVPDIVKRISTEEGRIEVEVLPGMVPDAPPVSRAARQPGRRRASRVSPAQD